MGEGQYIIFWWRGNSVKSSTYFTKAFLQSPGADVIMKEFTDVFRSEKIQGLGKKASTSASLTTLKPLTMLELEFSRSVMSDSLRPHGLQHPRLPCPSPTPGAYSDSCPLSQWCHPTILSSVFPFSSCLQSFPSSGSFLVSQLFTSSGQNIGVSASVSDLPINIRTDFL